MKRFLCLALVVALMLCDLCGVAMADAPLQVKKITLQFDGTVNWNGEDLTWMTYYNKFPSKEDWFAFAETDEGKALLNACEKYGDEHHKGEKCTFIVDFNRNDPTPDLPEPIYHIDYDEGSSYAKIGAYASVEDYPFGSFGHTVYFAQFTYTPTPVPSTGDNTPILLTASLLLLSGAALITLRKRTAK